MQRSPSAVSHTRRVVSKPKGGSVFDICAYSRSLFWTSEYEASNAKHYLLVLVH